MTLFLASGGGVVRVGAEQRDGGFGRVQLSAETKPRRADRHGLRRGRVGADPGYAVFRGRELRVRYMNPTFLFADGPL